MNQLKNAVTHKVLHAVSLKELDGVGIITFADPDSKVNTLSSKLIPQFEEILNFVETSPSIKSLVLISDKDNCFVAGANIEELRDASSLEEVEALSNKGKEFLDRLEKLAQPTICAINGSCLGGGLELALACSYRIATMHKSTTLGLPEVMLGLLPGAGGTQRLPKLIGLSKALPLILAGNALKPEKALKMGIVDHVIYSNDHLLEIALQAAKDLVSGRLKRASKKKDKTLVGYMEQVSLGRDFIFKQAKKTVLKKTRGLYPAPLAILKVMQIGAEQGYKKGCIAESKEFAKLSQTKEAKGLISLYFAQTDLKKNRFGKSSQEIEQVGVLGAGLMGSGISLVTLQRGLTVRMKDIDQGRLGKGKEYIHAFLQGRVKSKSMRNVDAQATLSRLYTQTDWAGFKQCPLVIEAVFEDLQLKHRVLKETEDNCAQDFIFASNTSALPISEIAKASKRPERVIGMHYFSPVQKMPLLEIIVTDKTDKEVAAQCVDIGMKQGKTVIVVNDGAGFYTTRILAPFMDEAAILVLEGADFHTLDRALQDFGYPVGPMTLIDEVGIDVAQHISHDLGKAFGARVSSADSGILNELVAKGHLGRKSGKGFYVYAKNKGMLSGVLASKGKEVNPYALELVKKFAKQGAKPASKKDMQLRMVYRMLNEAAYCVHDKILMRPLDGDIGAVFGLGFPPFHGGPFRYMDSIGIGAIVDGMQSYQNTLGERFAPCPLLLDMAKNAKNFYQ